MKKHFLKGRPERGGGTVFTNFLFLHDERVEDMIIDMKENTHSFNTKMGKQRVQHHDAVKLGCIMFLAMKIEIPVGQNSSKRGLMNYWKVCH